MSDDSDEDITNKAIFVSVWLLALGTLLAAISFTYKSITSKASKAAALAAFATGYTSPKKSDLKPGKEDVGAGKQDSSSSTSSSTAGGSGEESAGNVVVDDEWGIPTTAGSGSGKYGDGESGKDDEELGESGEVITYNLRLRFLYLVRTKIVNVVTLLMIIANLVAAVLLAAALFGSHELCSEASESSSSSSLSSSLMTDMCNTLFTNITFAMIWVCAIGLVLSVLSALFVTYCRTNVFYGIVCPVALCVAAVLGVAAFAVERDVATVALACTAYAVARAAVRFMFHTVNATCYDNNLGFVNCFIWFANEAAWVLGFVFVVYGFSGVATAVIWAVALVIVALVAFLYVKKLFDDVKWISIEEDKQKGIRGVLMTSTGGGFYNEEL